MKTATAAMLTMLSLTATAATPTDSDIKVEHLGVNNTLVRVDTDARYLMMPVQESNNDATVNVLVDGKLDRTIYVRMAKSKVDYSVPFDLAPYKGHDVVLNIITTQDRSDIREAEGDACWKGFTVTDSIDTTNTEKYRPAFHHTPRLGWMNDPNGMVYTDGRWHLYYQANPYGSKWQNMTWGHSSSTDLINWEHHPLAIEPDGLGAIFSGSCAVDSTNSAGFGKDAIIAMYTSAGASQMQSLAWSNDGGLTFEKYTGNPVITLDTEARDPNMFFDKDHNRWVLVLAHALDHEMLIFTSPDLKTWTLESSFGKGLGAQNGVWECPDLFPLKAEGSDVTKWVLLCNINPGGPFGGSATQYFVGDFDGKTFTPDTDAQGNVPTKWLDYGKDHYATVSWSDAPDGRRTAIGWMSNWQYASEVPTMQFRSANTLPREMQLFRADDGQYYVASAPSPELEALRADTFRRPSSMTVGARERKVSLPTANEGICEVLLTIDPRKASEVEMTLSNAAGEHVGIIYDVKARTLAFDRRESGKTDFSNDFPAVTVTPVYSADGLLTLRMFVDRSSIELFANGGRGVMTNLVFPTSPYTTMSIKAADGDARISNLTIYSLKPVTL